MLFNRVTESNFAALGIRLGAGRNFARTDTGSSAPVAIVNEAFGRTIAGGNPLDRRFLVEPTPGRPLTTEYEVVGVVPTQNTPISARSPSPPGSFLCSRPPLVEKQPA